MNNQISAISAIRIKVVNRHHGHRPDGDRRIYIGRGSPLGNPFRRDAYNTHEICIQAYEAWIRDRIAEGHHQICEALNDIAHKAVTGGVDLICFCAPKNCHGNVIKKLVTETLMKFNNQEN